MKRRIIIEIDDSDYRVPLWAISEAVGQSVFQFENGLLSTGLNGSNEHTVCLKGDAVARALTWDRGSNTQHILITGLAIDKGEEE